MKDKIFYSDTDEPVLLGDRIRFKKMFKSVDGEVVYVPGQSKPNAAFDSDMWAVQLDDEPRDVRSMPFFPEYEKYASKKIKLVKRGVSKKPVVPEEDIL